MGMETPWRIRKYHTGNRWLAVNIITGQVIGRDTWRALMDVVDERINLP